MADGATEAEILAAARSAGFASLADDARAKVREGVTTEAEMLKVVVD